MHKNISTQIRGKRHIFLSVVLSIALGLNTTTNSMEMNQERDYFSTLNKHLMLHIFSFADLSTLESISLVNKRTRALVKENIKFIAKTAIKRYGEVKAEIKEKNSKPFEVDQFPKYCQWIAILDKAFEKGYVSLNKKWFEKSYLASKDLFSILQSSRYKSIHIHTKKYKQVNPIEFFTQEDAQIFETNSGHSFDRKIKDFIKAIAGTTIIAAIKYESAYQTLGKNFFLYITGDDFLTLAHRELKKKDINETNIDKKVEDCFSCLNHQLHSAWENFIQKSTYKNITINNITINKNTTNILNLYKNDQTYPLFANVIIKELSLLNFSTSFNTENIFVLKQNRLRIPSFFAASPKKRVSTLWESIEQAHNEFPRFQIKNLFKIYLQENYPNHFKKDRPIEQILLDIVSDIEKGKIQIDGAKEILSGFCSAYYINPSNFCPLSFYEGYYSFNYAMEFLPTHEEAEFNKIPSDFSIHYKKIITNFNNIPNIPAGNASGIFLELIGKKDSCFEKQIEMFEKVSILNYSSCLKLEMLPNNLTEMRLLLLNETHLKDKEVICNYLKNKKLPNLQAVGVLKGILTKEICHFFDDMKDYNINVLFKHENNLKSAMSLKEFERAEEQIKKEKDEKLMKEKIELEKRQSIHDMQNRVINRLVEHYKINGWDAKITDIQEWEEVLDQGIDENAFLIKAKYLAFPNGNPHSGFEKKTRRFSSDSQIQENNKKLKVDIILESSMSSSPNNEEESDESGDSEQDSFDIMTNYRKEHDDENKESSDQEGSDEEGSDENNRSDTFEEGNKN